MVAKLTEKGLKTLDEIIMVSSHGTLKKMKFLMGERHHLHIYCHGIETRGGNFGGKVMGTCHYQKKNGAIIPCHYLKKGTHNSVSMIVSKMLNS